MIPGPPREAVAADEELDVPESQLQVAGGEPGRCVVFVLEELRLHVERDKVADLHAALEGQAAVGPAPE